MWKHIKILGISEKQRIKLGITVNFLKKKLKNIKKFLVSFYSFQGVQYF